MSNYLIQIENMDLHIPVFKPTERKISANPMRMMSGFYANRSKREVKTLLSGISLNLKRGERLGLLGRNGAGKTTLLRIIAGIYRPSSGKFYINGSSQGLFNVQLGMNNAATGIENIYLRGLQMGLGLHQIKDLLPEVIEFADVGDAINDVFENYSTGMRLRLSVAISTMIRPDILIMDEWIGSGDQFFREKINVRMKALIDESKGMVIATHSIPLLKSTCTHGMVLEAGESVFYGPINDAIEHYQNRLR